jgi:hypothetical protein
MISFQLVRGGSAIQILCDDQGIDVLVDTLKSLRGSGSHVHLWAPSIISDSSAELSDETPFGEKAVPEVIISHGGD